MTNAVIVTYRPNPSSPDHLPLWLDCWRHQLALRNQPMKMRHKLHIEEDKDTSGPFHKAALINRAVQKADTDYVTHIDVDCMMRPDFLIRLEGAIDLTRKLSFDVRHTDRHSARMCRDQGYQYMRATMLDHPEKHPLLWPTFPNQQYEGEHCIGNGEWTMRRSDFLEVGGMDERFLGFGFEDQEFNNRCLRYLGDTHMVPGADLFHLHHEVGKDSIWHLPELEARNKELYQKCQAHFTQRSGEKNAPTGSKLSSDRQCL